MTAPNRTALLTALLVVCASLSLLCGQALADEPAAASATTQPGDAATTQPAANSGGLLPDWTIQSTALGQELDKLRLRMYGLIDQGFTFNASSPSDRQNFGRFFDDRSNDYRFNQLLFTFDRPLKIDEDKFDWGFKAQVMYGTDARSIHFLGELDNVTNDPVQPDIVELYANLHLPTAACPVTPGGIDLKGGQFVTLMGAETIDPTGNFFYSHTYMFNFAIPFKHTGALATFHLPAGFDLIAGVTSGINTGWQDNNGAAAFDGALNWTSPDDFLWKGGKFLASSTLHAGPEDPRGLVDLHGNPINANSNYRIISDTVFTWTLNENWTLMTDINYGHEEAPLGLGGAKPEWYGVAQYVTYTINDQWSVGLRGEAFRDDDGFAVLQFGNNDDPMRLLRGMPASDPRTVGGGANTYYALTAGVNYKPDPKVIIRPEVRWDVAGNGRPFNDSQQRQMFTVGIDVILKF